MLSTSSAGARVRASRLAEQLSASVRLRARLVSVEARLSASSTSVVVGGERVQVGAAKGRRGAAQCGVRIARASCFFGCGNACSEK